MKATRTVRRDRPAPRARVPERHVFRLFVTGMTPRSSRAIENARSICEQHLPDRYDLDIVDLYRDPARARTEEIVAAPTLVRMRPLPLRRLVGDLSDTHRVLRSLGLGPAPVTTQ
jgi:circadian clock protein KaiB